MFKAVRKNRLTYKGITIRTTGILSSCVISTGVLLIPSLVVSNLHFSSSIEFFNFIYYIFHLWKFFFFFYSAWLSFIVPWLIFCLNVLHVIILYSLTVSLFMSCTFLFLLVSLMLSYILIVVTFFFTASHSFSCEFNLEA